jgi:hypothetical protein
VTNTTGTIEAIAEFRVLTNAYSAQCGGNGSVLNSVTKSGTNSQARPRSPRTGFV